MSNQTLINSGAAGGTTALALLDLLIAKGVITKGEATKLLADAQRAISVIHGTGSDGAQRVVGGIYKRVSKDN